MDTWGNVFRTKDSVNPKRVQRETQSNAATRTIAITPWQDAKYGVILGLRKRYCFSTGFIPCEKLTWKNNLPRVKVYFM